MGGSPGNGGSAGSDGRVGNAGVGMPGSAKPGRLIDGIPGSAGSGGKLGSVGNAGVGIPGSEKPGRLMGGNAQFDTAQLHGTGAPPPDGVAVPVRIHVSIFVRSCAPAAACVAGFVPANWAAKPTGEGGGVATNAGAIPPPTVVANAAKALSIPGAAAGEPKAVVRALWSAETAAATVVDGGTIAFA